MGNRDRQNRQPADPADQQGGSTGPAETQPTPAETTAAPSQETAAEAEDAAPRYAFPVPEEFKGKPGVDLLMEACTLYNVDPSDQAQPVQLLGWKFYPGDRRLKRPDRIVFVTAGGLKIAHPSDEDTYERLIHVFRLRRERKQKDGSVEIEVLPLPEDLSLPEQHVHGIPKTENDRRYEGGYLRSGGAAEHARREARRNAQLPN